MINVSRCAKHRVSTILQDIWRPQSRMSSMSGTCIFHSVLVSHSIMRPAHLCTVSHLKASKISHSQRVLFSPVKDVSWITSILYSLVKHLLTAYCVLSTEISEWLRWVPCPQGVYNLGGGQYYICLTVKFPRNPSRILSRQSINICWLNPGQTFLHQSPLSLTSPRLTGPRGSHWRVASPFPSTGCFLRGFQHFLNRCSESATSFFPQIIKCLHLTTEASS